MNKYAKSALIGVGALILSTVAIGASDALQNINGGLAGLLIESDGPCGLHSVPLLLGTHSICIDQYEASPSNECPQADASSDVATKENMKADFCRPVSLPERIPWRFVSKTEAEQLCARTGKRLPTNQEWYRAVSGITSINQCTINSEKPSLTGESECVSPTQVYDLVGNVWEWIDDQVVNGIYNGRVLPNEGYVAMVDNEGVAIETSERAAEDYGEDYFWSNKEGVRALLRGGYYGSGNDAGVYSLNAAVAPNFRTGGVGFRCVQDLL